MALFYGPSCTICLQQKNSKINCGYEPIVPSATTTEYLQVPDDSYDDDDDDDYEIISICSSQPYGNYGELYADELLSETDKECTHVVSIFDSVGTFARRNFIVEQIPKWLSPTGRHVNSDG